VRLPRNKPKNYKYIPVACVSGFNIKKYSGKTVEQCSVLCNNDPRCKSFEYGNGRPVKNKAFKKFDCHLQSAAKASRSCGNTYGLDLYIKTNGAYDRNNQWRYVEDACIPG
jgi:hypothetical protein